MSEIETRVKDLLDAVEAPGEESLVRLRAEMADVIAGKEAPVLNLAPIEPASSSQGSAGNRTGLRRLWPEQVVSRIVLAAAVLVLVALSVALPLALSRSTHSLPPTGPARHETSTLVTTPTTTTPNTTTPPPTTSSVPTTTLPAQRGYATLPVVGCTQESLPIPSDIQAAPASMQVRLPAGMSASHLAVYDDRLIDVVAPRAWHCAGWFYEDGQDVIAVYPPGGHAPPNTRLYQWTLKAFYNIEGVFADETSACFECTLSQAAEAFPAAVKTLDKDYSHSPAFTPRAGWHTQALSKTAVEFGYPDAPSSALGVITWNPSSHNGSYSETCNLPAADSGICSVAVQAFTAQYQSQ
ncbi:MAG: hypothetical protein ACRD0Z_04030 [Acidimicrobiales bacterium]